MSEPKSNIDTYHMINCKLREIAKLEARNKRLAAFIEGLYSAMNSRTDTNNAWDLFVYVKKHAGTIKEVKQIMEVK